MKTIQLDKERPIEININVSYAYEELTGNSVFELADNISMSLLRDLTYLGLKEADKDCPLTREMVGEYLNGEIVRVVSELLVNLFPKEKK